MRKVRPRIELSDWIREVLVAPPILVVGIDAHGRIVTFSRTCEELSGYGRAEVLGRDLVSLLVPESWRKVVATRLSSNDWIDLGRPHQHPWRTRSGDERLIEWRYFRFP